MDTMNAKYRCRLCKKEYRSGIVDSSKIAKREMYLLVTGYKSDCVQAPGMTTLHNCDNGSFGLADFIGWELDNE